MSKFAPTLLALLVLAGYPSIWPAAQEEAVPPEQPAGLQLFADRLASTESRVDTLLQLAAVMRVRQRMADGERLDPAGNVGQERAWLDRLQERHGPALLISPILDPAAWMIRQNLLRQGLPMGRLLTVSGPSLNRLLHATFQRTDERLAASALPELLWRLEGEATLHWVALLEQAAANDDLRAGMARAVPAWPGADPADDGAENDPDTLDMLTALARDAVEVGPPDRLRIEALRRQVMVSLPDQEPQARPASVAFMRLGTLIHGLHEGQFTRFAEGLLAVVGDLLAADQATAVPVAAWLTDELPRISAAYARGFAEVDPRLNSAVAAAFDAARSLVSGDTGLALGDEVADAVAQLALLMPDIQYYFGLPIRDTIVGNVDACVGLMAQNDDSGRPTMGRELFDDCTESLVRMADAETRSTGLSGGPAGPFGATQLQREVSVTPVQRINYGLGYLGDRFAINCAAPPQPLPNPLEWSSLANLLAWFAEQMPVYFQTPQNEARLERMRQIGNQMIEAMAEQVACYSGSGAVANDPVTRLLADYNSTLNELSSSLQQAVDAFRASVLAPGADIALEADALQKTLYRPEDLQIGPCEPDNVCEMSAALSANRALVGLFPEPYLVADQSGLGAVQICYDKVEWVDRRSEPVRADDENVANYFGHFAFDLKGRFIADGQARDVFGFRFTSPDEYHYLFAAASEEVLADACPMEWVGSRIVTPLPGKWAGVVPNRLTYLAAPRMLPSRLMEQNWEQGAEWRDWFTTGLGVVPLDIEPQGDIVPLVNEHLQALFQREQAAIYRGLLDGVGLPGDIPLRAHVQDLSTRKSLVRMLLVLLYPRSMLHEDEVRLGIAGQGGLLDEDILRRFRDLDVPVDRITDLGTSRQEAFRAAWRGQADATLRSGSVSTGVAHAIFRLDQVYWDYFRTPATEPDEPEPTDPAPSSAVLSDSEPLGSDGG